MCKVCVFCPTEKWLQHSYQMIILVLHMKSEHLIVNVLWDIYNNAVLFSVCRDLCSFLTALVSSLCFYAQRLIRKSLQTVHSWLHWLRSILWQWIIPNAAVLLETSSHNVINCQRTPLKPSQDFTACSGSDLYYPVNYVLLASKWLFLLSSVKWKELW